MSVKRQGESGNVFFTLFGAIALVGVIGVATATLMRGPVGTMMAINQKAKVDSQLQIARKLVALNAVTTAGDCDGDGSVEPSPPDTGGSCTISLTGGGCIPSTVGAAKTDPWGTQVGYCGWNHGTSTSGGGCSAGLLQGTNATDKTVIALISAGPDRVFQTTCGNDPAYVTKGGDDIIDMWTFDEAQTMGGGGLWTLQSGKLTPSGSQDVNISNNATFASGKTADFQGTANFGAGSQLNLANGGLFNLPTQVQMPDASCNGANDGVLRINTTGGPGSRVLEICNGTSFISAGSMVSDLNSLTDAVSDSATGANLFLGNNGGNLISGALRNTAAGINAGQAVTTANDNVLLGYNAGKNIATGNGNIFIGSSGTGTTMDGSAAAANTLNIGNTIFGTGLYSGSGSIGINNPTPSATLDVNGSLKASSGTFSGTLAATGAVTAGSTLDVTGATTLGNTLSVAGNVSAPGGTVNVASNLDTTGNGSFTGTLTVGGATTINNTLHGTGNATFDNDLDVTGHVSAGSDMSAANYHVGLLTSGIGMFTDGSNGLQLETNSLKRLQITSGGAVGIGVTSPATELDVGGAVRVGGDVSACGPGLYGAIRYTSATDKVEACSNTNAWVTIGTSGGGGGGGGGFWLAGAGSNIYYALGNVGIGTATPNTALEVAGALRLSGTTQDNFLTPVGSTVPTKINVPLFDPGNFGQVIAMGVPATANATSRVMSILDARAAAHQPSISIFNPNEADVIGFSWEGDNNNAYVKTLAGNIGFRINTTDIMTVYNSGNVGIGASGATKLDVGGTIRIANGGEACAAGTAGGIRYNGGLLEYCDGAGWIGLASAASTTAPGADREVVFNSGGVLGADAGLVYTSAGRLGIGTATPAQKLEVAGNALVKGLIYGGTDATPDANYLDLSPSGEGDIGALFGFSNGAALKFLNEDVMGTGNEDLFVQLWTANAAAYSYLESFNNAGLVVGSGSGPVIFRPSRTEVMRVDTTGVGIGTAGPATILDVNGTIRVANGGEACAAAIAGGIRYSSASLQYCDGTNWTSLASAATASAAGADGQVQFNSGGVFGASANFYWDKANSRLGMSNATPAEALSMGTPTVGKDIGIGYGGRLGFYQQDGSASIPISAYHETFGTTELMLLGGTNCSGGVGSMHCPIAIPSTKLYFDFNWPADQIGSNPNAIVGIGANSSGSVANILNLYNDANNGTAVNSGASLRFATNVTGTKNKAMARIYMNPTDVTAAANADLVFSTTNAGTQTDWMNLKNTGDLYLLGTGATQLQVGTTLQRPGTAANGMIRYNSDNGKFEAYQAGAWQDILTSSGGNNSPFERVGTVVRPNASVVTLATDDFVFGSPTLDYDSDGNHIRRMFFNKALGAFRAGYAADSSWDNANIGYHSVGLGVETKAAGEDSFAVGERVDALGRGDIAMGTNIWGGAHPKISADYSAAFFMQNQIGVDLATSNVLALMGGKLYINPGSGAPYTLSAVNYDLGFSGNAARTIGLERHTTAGTAGNSLTLSAGGATSGATDKNGGDLVLSGGTATGDGTSKLIFEGAGYGTAGTADVTPAEVGRISGGGFFQFTGTDGSGDTMAAATGNGSPGDGTRMVWYPRKAAFRAGLLNDGVGEWDDVNIGDSSFAFGNNTQASGSTSATWGIFNYATAQASTAWGISATSGGQASTAFGQFIFATGKSSVAFGQFAQATGDYSLAVGLNNTNTSNFAKVSGTGSFGIFMQDQHNKDMTANDAMGLFGGRFVLDPNSQATLLAPNANTDLDVNGNIGAINYCDVGGANCFTAAGVSGAIAGATPGGPFNSIQYNSAGGFGGSANLTWDNTNGRLGIGTSSPGAQLVLNNGVTDSLSISSVSNPSIIDSSGHTFALQVNGGTNIVMDTGASHFSREALFGGDTGALKTSGKVGIGTTSPVAPLDVQLAHTATSGNAYGVRMQQTLTAAANNDVLNGLYINPTFTDGAFTGVQHNGLVVTGGNVGFGTTPLNNLTVQAISGATSGVSFGQGNYTNSMGQVAAGGDTHAVLSFTGNHQSQGVGVIKGFGLQGGLVLEGLNSTTTPSISSTIIRGGKWNGAAASANLANTETLLQVQKDDGTVLMTMLGDGKTLIAGTGAPAAALQVNGTLVIADGGESCAAGTAGGIRYNGGNLQYCNGAAWTSVSTGSGTPAGANTQVQFNSGGAFGASANFTWSNATNTLTASQFASGAGGKVADFSGVDPYIYFNFTHAYQLGVSGAGNFALYDASNGLTPVFVDTAGNVGIGNATAPVDVLSIGTAPTASATHALVNLSNTALSGGSANGTYIGANPAAFTGDFFNFQINGSTKVRADSTSNGQIYLGGPNGIEMNYQNLSQQGVLNNGAAADWFSFLNNEGGWVDSGAYAQNYIRVKPTYNPSAATVSTTISSFAVTPTFDPSASTPTVNGQWISGDIKGTFGSGDEKYNAANPMVGLRVAPTINVGTTSTGGVTALLVNPTLTSVSATATNYLADFQAGGSSKMAITAAGNVGIGTATPTAPLDVEGAFSVYPTLLIKGTATGNAAPTSPVIQISTNFYGLSIGAANTSPNAMWLQTTSGAPLALQPTGGAVGLRTQNPATLLDVNGTIRVADGGEACAAGVAGGIRYNGGTLQYCNGTAWTSLASGTGAAAGSTGQIQFNSGGAFAASANLFWDIANGRLGLGTASPAYPVDARKTNVSVANGADYLMNAQMTVAPAATANGANMRRVAINGAALVPAANTQSLNKIDGVYGWAENDGTGNVGETAGVIGFGYNSANATVGYVAGSWLGAESDNGTVTDVAGTDVWAGIYGGTVTNQIGLRVSLDGSASATNRYGIYITAPTGAGAPTNDFGIYQSGTQKNRLNGSLGIGLTPTSALHVSGDGRFTGNLTADAAGSSAASPRTVGIGTNDWAAGEAGRVQFGDIYNSWGVAWNDRMLMQSYWGIEIHGSRQAVDGGAAFTAGAASDANLAVVNDNDVVGLAVVAKASETANLQEWRDSSGTPLSVVSAAGKFGVGKNGPAVMLDVNGTLKIANGGETCTVAGDGGMVRYSGGSLQYCNGTAWTSLAASGGNINLGTAVNAANPQVSGDATTGFYTPGAGQVAVTNSGVETMLWNASATGVNYFTVAAGATGNTPTISNGGADTNGAGLGLKFLGRNASAAGVGGGIRLDGGTGNGAFAGGSIQGTAGQGGATGAGGQIILGGGAGGATSGAGGAVSLTGGAATAGNSAGGSATLASGAGQGSQPGGTVALTGGAGGATGSGGPITATAGAGGSTSGTGGAVTITAGAGTAGNSAGGAASLLSGAGQGNQPGGTAAVTGGAGGATGTGGAISIAGGSGGATSGVGGAVTITGGAGTAGNSAGGNTSMAAGAGQGSQNGGAASLTGGAGGATGAGGAASITGGAAAGGTATDKAGGNVTISAGQSTGQGESYVFFYAPVPTTGTGTTARAPVEAVRVNGSDMGFNPRAGTANGYNLMFNGDYNVAANQNQYLQNGSAFEIFHNNATNTLTIAGAASGTAGNPITYNNGIVMTATGAVGVGATPTGFFHISPPVTNIAPALRLTGATNTTNITASTEVPDLDLALNRTETWATGALALQEAVKIGAPTYNFAGASTLTEADTVSILGAPIKGANTTLSNTYALNIGSSAVGAATNSFGLKVAAQTGATNNYSAVFTGGNLGIGNTAPAALLDVGASSTTLGTLRLENSANGFYTQFQPSTTATAAATYTLPTAPPTVSGQVLASTTGGVLSWANSGIGGGPFGSNTQVAFNDSGTESGNAGLTFDKTNGALSISSRVAIGATAGAAAPTALKLSQLGDTSISGPTNGQCLSYNGTSWINSSSCGSGGSGALSALTAATATNSIDNLNFGQTWNWSTLAGSSALKLSTTSTLAATNTQKMFEIAMSGANATASQTTYGAYIINGHTGTSAADVGLAVASTGPAINEALYASATGGTTNFAAIFDQGNVGIGNTAPGVKLELTPSATTDGILVDRQGTGATNAGAWFIGVLNSAGTAALDFGASSSTYTTGGTAAWLGNSESFFAYPSSGKFKIGTGNGATPVMTFDTAGKVAINTGTTTTALNVAGSLMVGNGNETCSGATYAGAIRYNAGSLQYCDSSSWKTVGNSTAAAGTPAGSDKQVQFNDGGSAMGGNANMTFDKSTNTFTATNITASTKINLTPQAGAAAPSTANTAVISVTKQVFTASGTYTAPTGLLYAIVECVGGGGGGGYGITNAGASGGGGGGGGYSRITLTAATIGASQTVTVGGGGAGGTTGGVAAGNGGDTSLGTLCVGKGGTGGTGSTATGYKAGGAGGVAGTGDVTSVGEAGAMGLGAATTMAGGGNGGSSVLGGGGAGGNDNTGSNGGNYGGGGGGGARSNSSNTSHAGGAGAGGIIIVTEYKSQ